MVYLYPHGVIFELLRSEEVNLTVKKKDNRKGNPRMGRPSDLNDSLKKVILHLYSMGYTDKQVADAVGKSEQTINTWKKDDNFIESIKDAKANADEQVEIALFQRAVGYSHEEEVIKVVAIGGNRGSEVERVNTTKHYAPDVKACEFWLKNRKPGKWREKQEVEHEVSTIQIDDFDKQM